MFEMLYSGGCLCFNTMSYSLVDVMFQYYVVLIGGCWWMLCFNTMSYSLVNVLIINACVYV